MTQGLLKNVRANFNFEGSLGLLGEPDEESILRSHESDFLEKQDDSSQFQRLSLPARLIIGFVLCQCRLNTFIFKKGIKKWIHWRNYRYHPSFKELIISGMVLKHLYNFENKRSYNILKHFLDHAKSK